MLRLLLVLMMVGLARAQAPVMSPFQKGPVPFALLRESWVEDVDAGRVFSIASRYIPDATVSNPDGTHAEGVRAVQVMFGDALKHFTVDVRLSSRVTSESGELAYDSGSYTQRMTDRASGAVVQLHGDYLTVYRRNGMQWLIVQQAWTGASGAAK